MPNKWTFTIKPVKSLLEKYMDDGLWVDPFAGLHSPANLTNDLNPAMPTDHHFDALSFLRGIPYGVDGVLFDPPYSTRQVSEVYKSFGIKVTMEDTQNRFWSALKSEIARIVKPDGIVISCGWNSGGVGKKLGFSIEEILLVPHGGWHNDTIVTVERKNAQ